MDQCRLPYSIRLSTLFVGDRSSPQRHIFPALAIRIPALPALQLTRAPFDIVSDKCPRRVVGREWLNRAISAMSRNYEVSAAPCTQRWGAATTSQRRRRNSVARTRGQWAGLWRFGSGECRKLAVVIRREAAGSAGAKLEEQHNGRGDMENGCSRRPRAHRVHAMSSAAIVRATRCRMRSCDPRTVMSCRILGCGCW